MTPLMSQYNKIKESHKDSILFFRLGDFYEMFYDDAKIASNILGITLTSRDKDKKIPMAGIPFHSANSYIAKLVSSGRKVAICEQSNSLSGKIVKREVVKIVTPGTFSDPDFLDEKSNNYILSISVGKNGSSISYVDISTGECKTTEFGENLKSLFDRVLTLSPKEILLSIVKNEEFEGKIKRWAREEGVLVNSFVEDRAEEYLLNFFNKQSLLGLGLGGRRYSLVSTASLLKYLSSLQDCGSIRKLIYEDSKSMILDYITQKNLNLFEDRSLLQVIDKTKSAMGGRFLKRALSSPLLDRDSIEKRYEDISFYISNAEIRSAISEQLNQVLDFERSFNRVLRGEANIRDLNCIKNSLRAVLSIYKIHSCFSIDILKIAELYKLLDDSILESNNTSIKEGNIINPEYNSNLKELHEIDKKGKSLILDLETRERAEVGKIKVGYNKVFGYYLEVSRANKASLPERYIRRQTLANAERYITLELKELEDKILGAKEQICKLEYDLFCEISEQIKEFEIDSLVKEVEYLDFVVSLAEVAIEKKYVKPEIVDQNLSLEDSRHAIVEHLVDNFISNSIDIKEGELIILTGPNMAGKSTFMKQVALIQILAQIGSFVPAKHAKIKLVDRVFTRVGASDSIASGESTFMVEMNEVSNILTNATKNSLVILDEVGRGTSTYDGLSIARAVTEHIAEKIKCKTIFATHYHEMNELESIYDNLSNYRVDVKEEQDRVIFLKKIVRGGADKSYGIEVARLAGLPQNVLERAKDLLKEYNS